MKNHIYHYKCFTELMYIKKKYSLGKKIDTYICITESLCCVSETIMTLLINYTPI